MAKLCDFKNAKTKDRTAPRIKPGKEGVSTRGGPANSETTFTYDSIYG
jgi:hypothetical protein